jgi:pimeloyl-ACP methyl ester carboxylesterase
LTRSELRQTIVDSTLEAVRSGTRGTVWEGRLYTSAWTFRLQDIRTEIHLWHGERDVSVPPAMGYFQARSLPNCRARFYPEEGHFSLVTNHMAEFFEVLTSRG